MQHSWPGGKLLGCGHFAHNWVPVSNPTQKFSSHTSHSTQCSFSGHDLPVSVGSLPHWFSWTHSPALIYIQHMLWSYLLFELTNLYFLQIHHHKHIHSHVSNMIQGPVMTWTERFDLGLSWTDSVCWRLSRLLGSEHPTHVMPSWQSFSEQKSHSVQCSFFGQFLPAKQFDEM